MQNKEIILPELLDGSAFDGLRNILMEAVICEGEVTIDASQVERLTTPCAQLLGAFLQVRQELNQKSKLANISANFRALWGDFGFSEHFSAT